MERICPVMRRCLIVILLLGAVLRLCAAEGEFPAWYVTTANLNVRAECGTYARILTVLPRGSRVRVEGLMSPRWARVTDGVGNVGYVSTQYIRYEGAVVEDAGREEAGVEARRKEGIGDAWSGVWIGWVVKLGLALLVIAILRRVGEFVLVVVSVLLYRVDMFLCFPFYLLNWLQRWLSKPWRLFYKSNSRNDRKNAEMREMWEKVKIPLYVVLTPLRFVNAVFFNLVVHCGFEMYNYAMEVVLPSNDKEGADNSLLLILLIPWRVLKYVVWHGGLTVVESVVWTVVDTFVPALTLYHGTDAECGVNITHAGRCGYSNRKTGIWNVGAGNYAGNGIYFAPVRSTAEHYARGHCNRALIVCRVSLGKVLDLGMAPWNVYKQCGHANALEATRWGLNNGYTTGEWWREDGPWWEYCMYDWQNRYNHSWRIRPLYVLNLSDKQLLHIPGGMCHWLFRKMVIEDLVRHFEEMFD